jgi:hypothetical protein
MKREIAEYVAVCDSCQRIKEEYQRPAGLLQQLQIPQWKWDKIGMDFKVGLPCTRAGYNSNVGRTIYVSDCVLAWRPKEDSIRQRHLVHFSFLAATT